MYSLQRSTSSLAELLKHHLIHLRDMALVEFLSYFLIGAAVFALVMHLHRRGVFRLMIRAPGPRPAQVHREVYNSALSVVLYNGVQLVTRIFVLAFGYIVTLNAPMPLWEIALTFPLVLDRARRLLLLDAPLDASPGAVPHLPLGAPQERRRRPCSPPTRSRSPRRSCRACSASSTWRCFPATFATLIFFQFVEILHNLVIHSGVDVFPAHPGGPQALGMAGRPDVPRPASPHRARQLRPLHAVLGPAAARPSTRTSSASTSTSIRPATTGGPITLLSRRVGAALARGYGPEAAAEPTPAS